MNPHTFTCRQATSPPSRVYAHSDHSDPIYSPYGLPKSGVFPVPEQQVNPADFTTRNLPSLPEALSNLHSGSLLEKTPTPPHQFSSIMAHRTNRLANRVMACTSI